MKKSGFIGVGIMGKSMVRNLMKAGYEVNIYARHKENVEDVISEGALFHETIAGCVSDCEAVITIVGYPSDVEEVYYGTSGSANSTKSDGSLGNAMNDGILKNVRPGTYLIDMTTTSPELDQRIAKDASARDCHFLDAPVTGGTTKAEKGTLSILVGGEAEDYEACLGLFSAMGKTITHYGKAGSGQHAKLTNQIMQANIMTGICEGISYAKSKGLDMGLVLEGSYGGAAQSFLLDSYGERICDGDLNPGFYIDFLIKDMKLAYDSAELEGLELSNLRNIISQYEKLSENGYGRLGMQALIKAYE